MQYPQAANAAQMMKAIAAINTRLGQEAEQIAGAARCDYIQVSWQALEYSASHQTGTVVYAVRGPGIFRTAIRCCEVQALPEVMNTRAEIVLLAAYRNGRRVEAAPEASASGAERPHYCDTPGANREAYLASQQSMFKAARDAGLATGDASRKVMIEAINSFLKINISSRKQLTPEEMNAVTAAIVRGHFTIGWFVRRAPIRRTVTVRAA